MSKFKNALLAAVGLLLLSNVLLLTQRNTAQAQTPGVNLAALVAQVNTLQSKLANDENTIASQATTISSLRTQEQTDIKNTQNQEQTDIQNIQKQEQGDVKNLNSTLTAQGTSLGKLQTLTTPLSLSSDPNVGGVNTLLTIKGVNVQIVDGNSSGLTDDGIGGEVKGAKLTGLGNLIIGYNATGNSQGAGDVRTGSHNLILGDRNSYGSFGSLIAGQNDTVSGGYASVSGGQNNTASGYAASVSGGAGNTASNYYTSVSGGVNNTASAYAASVSGGDTNKASNEAASVSGGYNITQTNDSGWSGGSYHSP